MLSVLQSTRAMAPFIHPFSAGWHEKAYLDSWTAGIWLSSGAHAGKINFDQIVPINCPVYLLEVQNNYRTSQMSAIRRASVPALTSTFAFCLWLGTIRGISKNAAGSSNPYFHILLHARALWSVNSFSNMSNKMTLGLAERLITCVMSWCASDGSKYKMNPCN